MMKFIIACLFFVSFSMLSSRVYAADIEVSGKVLDQKNNPVSNSAIVFTNQSGKTIRAVTTDISGLYSTTVPNGTYTISVNGPRGTSLLGTSMSSVSVSQRATLNFVLKAPEVSPALKPTHVQQITPYVIGGGIVIIIVLAAYLLYRRRHISA